MFLCIIWKHKSTLYLPHDICLFVFFFFSRFTSRLFLSEFILLFVAQCTFKFGMFKLFLAYKIHQNIRAIEPYRITIKKSNIKIYIFIYFYIQWRTSWMFVQVFDLILSGRQPLRKKTAKNFMKMKNFLLSDKMEKNTTIDNIKLLFWVKLSRLE